MYVPSVNVHEFPRARNYRENDCVTHNVSHILLYVTAKMECMETELNCNVDRVSFED